MISLCIFLALLPLRLPSVFAFVGATFRQTIGLALCCAFALFTPGPAAAEVRQPNGDYVQDQVDLTVKVLGGELQVRRLWANGRWYLNPEWAPLRFELDTLDNSVKTIERLGLAYEKSGNDVYALNYSRFIKRTSTGWQWYDTVGNKIDYDTVGRALKSTDKNAVTLTFELDAQGHRTAVKDHFGATTLTYTYASGELASIADRTGRTARYTYATNAASGKAVLASVTDLNGNSTTYTYDNNDQILTSTDAEGHATTIVYLDSHPSRDADPGDSILKSAKAVGDVRGSIGYRRAQIVQNRTELKRSGLSSDGADTQKAGGLCPWDPRIDRDDAQCVDPNPANFIAISSAPPVSTNYQAGARPSRPISRVFKLTDASNKSWTYEYNYDQVKRQYVFIETGPSGKRVAQLFDYRGYRIRRDIGSRSTYLMQAVDTKTEEMTDERGLVTRVEYDSYRNPQRVVYPDGSAVRTTYQTNFGFPAERIDERGVVTRWSYDGKGNVTRMTEAAGSPDEINTEFTYDGYGQRLTATLKGRAALTTPVNLPAVADAIYQFAYDNYGNITTLTDPEGNVTRYTSTVEGSTDTETDARSSATRYRHNAAGWLTQITEALGTPIERSFTLGYDKVGNITSETSPKSALTGHQYDARNLATVTTDPNSKTRRTEYDEEKRMTRWFDEDNRSIKLTYDLEGRLRQLTDDNGNIARMVYALTQSEYAQGAQPLKITYPTFERQFKYDLRDRIVMDTAVAGQEGLVRRYKYGPSGLTLEATDAEGYTTYFEYDGLGRTTKITDRLDAAVSINYDTRDNVVRFTDARGGVTTFDYDRLNRITQTTDPLGRITTYAYDAVGNVTTKTDARGYRLAHTYDALDRVIRTQEYAAATPATLPPTPAATPYKTTQFTYDASDNLLTWSDGKHSASYTYDSLERLTSKALNYGGGAGNNQSLGFSQTYTPSGQIASFTGADGAPITYTYDAQGEITSATIPNHGTLNLTDFVWRRPQKASYPNGLIEEWAYDGYQRPTSIRLKNATNQVLASLTQGYDAREQIKEKGIDGEVRALGYDKEERLTSAVVTTAQGSPALAPATQSETFTVDATGNRVTHSAVSGNWTYNAANQLTSVGNTTFEYDLSGNLSKRSLTSGASGANATLTQYRYDAKNRLTQVEDGVGNVIVTYDYDPMDQRLWKDVSPTSTSPNAGTRTHYLYAAQGLIAESDATAITAASGAQAGTVASTLHYGWEPNTGDSTAPLYVKRGNGTLADTDTNASTITWLHYDELGTPIRGTNRAGQIVWSARPDAAAQFGGTLISYPQGQAATTVPVINLRMAGQYFDAETGLHYNDRRYFDPASARYLSRDPIKELDPQQSLYGYALHNPVNITDPTGEVPIIPIGIAILKCAAQCAAFAALSNPCDPDFSDCGLPCLLPWNWAGPKFGKGPKGPKPGPCPVNSFTADTLVHAVHTNADGTTQTLLKRIDEMKVGELVVSVAEWQGSDTTKHETTHQTAHKTTYQPITDIITSLKEQRLITITLDSGEQIKATHSHPFLTPDGWRAAQLLQAGGQLDLKGRRVDEVDALTNSAQFVTIANVEIETTTVRVYNLEVANTHTFLVGEQGIVVHNGRGKGAGGGSGNGSGASGGGGGGRGGASGSGGANSAHGSAADIGPTGNGGTGGHGGNYKPPPRGPLPGFPDAKRDGHLGDRARWRLPDGFLLWDSLHGRCERYDKRGKHQGEFDVGGGRTKPRNPNYDVNV